MIDHIKSVFGWVEKERQRLERGKPSMFGFPGSEFTPHHSDYYEVYLLWDFVGEVARLQNNIQNYFNFRIEDLSKPVSLTSEREATFLAIERELPFVPPDECGGPHFDEKQIEQVDLITFSVDWQGFPIYFKCGYGRQANRLVFSNVFDYSVPLGWGKL